MVSTSYEKSSLTGVPLENVQMFHGGEGIEPYISTSSTPNLKPSDPQNLEWVEGFSANAKMLVNKGYFAEHLCKVDLMMKKVWPLSIFDTK